MKYAKRTACAVLFAFRQLADPLLYLLSRHAYRKAVGVPGYSCLILNLMYKAGAKGNERCKVNLTHFD